MTKKYSVTYNFSPHTCGVDHEYNVDTIEEVFREANEAMRDYYAAVRIYDRKLGDFVFWKDSREKPSIDMLIKPENHHRDLRTRDRKAH